jgi:hypothetical protein
VSLGTLPSCANHVNIPLEEVIEALIGIFLVRLLISPDRGFELSKEFLNRI